MNANPVSFYDRRNEHGGFVAVPIMAAMMLVVSRGSAMGKFTAKPRLLFFGWAATIIMAVAAVAMIVAQ